MDVTLGGAHGSSGSLGHLDAGKPYLSVQEQTGASSTTVSRVSKCLNGAAGGYRVVLDRLAGK